MKTDRPRRTSQGLKLTLAALLTALALQPDAVAQSFAVSNLGQGGEITRDIVASTATSFTVGPPPEGLTGWTLDKVTGRFWGITGSPSGFQAMILNDDSSKPDIFNSPLATLTGPDPRGRRDYDFVPPAGTTIFLEPETTYWLVYTSAGLPSNFNYYRTRSRTDMSQAGLRGWDIGNDLWFWDSNDGAWERLRTGTRGEIRLPMKFGVEATPVPEPSEYALFFALGLGAFVFWHRRCQREQRTAA